MGIRGLSSNLKYFNKGKVKHLSSLKGCIIDIDASNMIYKFKIKCANNKDQTWELLLFNLLQKLIKYKTKIRVVFDGKPSKEKFNVIQKRKKERELAARELKKMECTFESNISYEDITNIVEENEFNMRSINLIKINSDVLKKQSELIKKSQNIKVKDIDRCKEILDLLNIPYIHVPDMEADSVFKYLQINNKSDYCFTNDSDSFAYGCNVINDLDFNHDTVKVYNYVEILQDFNITNEQMKEICICCGTDYNESIGYKFNDLLKIFKQYGCLSNIIENNVININTISLNFLENFDYVFDLFNQNEYPNLEQYIKNSEYQSPTTEFVAKNVQYIGGNIMQFYIKYIYIIPVEKEKIKYTKKLNEYSLSQFKIKMNL
jgi:5'-3' exonuclease